MPHADVLVLMIAPNASEQLGGEAIKALQSFLELRKLHPNTFLITHERNEPELIDKLALSNVLIVRDDSTALLLWKSVILRSLIDVWFSRKAVAFAAAFAARSETEPKRVIVHQVEPNSPVVPRSLARGFVNAFGPINGNIYYPSIFQRHESAGAKLRRILHMPIQTLNRLVFRGLGGADLILVAGGDRTRDSLLIGGAKPESLIDSIDCGVKEELLDRPRIEHRGMNPRFIHFGRLMFHKCTFLIIESLAKTKTRTLLDVVGKGPELDRCQKLAKALGVEDRVRFLGWYDTHAELMQSLGNYRGMVFPSIEDANGIVVQEAMALGLPSICLDWGGPQLLVQHGRTGYLIEPKSTEHITTSIAECMDRLAEDGDLAERMSVASREAALNWRWSVTMAEWLGHYDEVLARRGQSDSRSPVGAA